MLAGIRYIDEKDRHSGCNFGNGPEDASFSTGEPPNHRQVREGPVFRKMVVFSDYMIACPAFACCDIAGCSRASSRISCQISWIFELYFEMALLGSRISEFCISHAVFSRAMQLSVQLRTLLTSRAFHNMWAK